MTARLGPLVSAMLACDHPPAARHELVDTTGSLDALTVCFRCGAFRWGAFAWARSALVQEIVRLVESGGGAGAEPPATAGPALPEGFAREDLLACVEREIRMRETVYPKRVETGQMRARTMQDEIRTMCAVRAAIASFPATPAPQTELFFRKGPLTR